MSNADRLWHLLEGARVYDLGQPLDPSMPVSPNHPGFRMALIRRHGDMVRADGGSAASEMFVTGGHVGTHIDALAHVSHQGKLHGGVDAYEAQTGGRFLELGIDRVSPIVCRGVLLDVAGLYDVPTLPAGYAITAQDLRRAADRAGIEVRAGDAVLVRSGWAANWSNPAVYIGHDAGVPGVDVSGAEQIAAWGSRATGHDSVAYEQIRPGAGHSLLPVHRILLVEHGIFIVENLNLEQLASERVCEFLFVVTPLKLVGATGSPVRPIAVVTQ
ncbi:MAG: cyclase family protein [Chloroflexota bacterium]|nr:MAG: cyclase family protein [Chloroflexota bacterium]